MHIAVLSDPANFHTQKWATALQRVGARVTIFSFSDYQMDDVECVKIPPGFTLNGNITYASYLYSTDKLLKEVKARKVDLLNPLNITPFGVWATRTGFEPVVSVAMGADILEYPPTRKESNIPDSRIWSSNTTQSPGPIGKMVKDVKWRMFRNQVQEALHKSALITGDNIQLVQAIKNWFGIPEHKVKLNRWGIEEELFEVSETQKQALREKFNIRDWQKVVLSPRGMKPVYQGDLILESFEMLLRRGVRDINMIMLSAGYDVPPKVAQKANELNKQFPNFHYVSEQLPREEVIALWSLVDAFISAPVYDGYSNAVSEGRYAGAIPIVNPIPANLELIRHKVNGWVVDPFTPQHLADALLEMLPVMDEYKDRFAGTNRKWILKHSHLDTNINIFYKDCRKVLNQYRRKGSLSH